ncbi:RNA-directed DNA polymerase, eukaryota, reverse transcriptase zinc-binding domain protein, partial [Tanacetum coccineum]
LLNGLQTHDHRNGNPNFPYAYSKKLVIFLVGTVIISDFFLKLNRDVFLVDVAAIVDYIDRATSTIYIMIYGFHSRQQPFSLDQHKASLKALLTQGALLKVMELEDKWYGEVPFKDKFKRCFNFELQKDIYVVLKLQSNDIALSFRRSPRSGIEESQFGELNNLLTSVVLSNAMDRWSWSLCGHGNYSVKSAREYIDQQVLISSSTPTRWSKVIPIKLNIFMWRLALDKLPTRNNLAKRGIIAPCSLCHICRMDIESRDHLRCGASNSFPALLYGHGGLDSGLRLKKLQKLVLEASFSSLWWHIWVFRNAYLFSDKKSFK